MVDEGLTGTLEDPPPTLAVEEVLGDLELEGEDGRGP